MAENQRGWGQQGHHERYDQSRDENRGRDEDQHRYQGSENRYNSPGYGSGEYGGTSSSYGGSSSWGQQERDRGYERGHYGSGSSYSSAGMQPGYGQRFEHGSSWGNTPRSGWGSPGYGSQGYGGPGYSGGHGLRQHYYGSGLGSSGTWGGSSGALSGSEYGSGNEYRRSSYGSGYSGSRSHDQPHWQNQKQQHDDRGFWEKSSDEMSSLFGDEEADRRREFDRRMSDFEQHRRGMEEYNQGRYYRSPYGISHRGKGPKAYKRSDDRIREDISDRLADDERLDASEIEINVHDAEVTLNGTVDSRESKRRAEDIVEMVSGVQHVQNNIRINREWETIEKPKRPSISSSTGSIK